MYKRQVGDRMKKIVLIDGNNLMFRSYYATAYTGNTMKNSKGFPTNALYGFTNMINKIEKEEKPEYVLVAFDKGKTFRHEKYPDYKGGRMEVPDELREQFPKAKEMLEIMGLTYLETDNYEADDIIGTFAKRVEESEDFCATIVSSDKDLLQLVSPKVDYKLLKQHDYLRINVDNFKDHFGIEPPRIVDLKALQGDASDNIPGVKGIGEKTATKLLVEYGDLDGVYEHIEEMKGAVKKKLEADKENAYMSKDLATIYKEVPIDLDFEGIRNLPDDRERLLTLYKELEFYSFIKNMELDMDKEALEEDFLIQEVSSIDEIRITGPVGIHLDLDMENYHMANILGMAVYNEETALYIPADVLMDKPSFLTEVPKYVYDVKRMIVALRWKEIPCEQVVFDTMLAAYLLNYNTNKDVSYLANSLGYPIQITDKKHENTRENSVKKARFVYETYQRFQKELEENHYTELYETLDFPLAFVLADMEFTGVRVDQSVLSEMGEEIQVKMDLLASEIYDNAGYEFNIMSPSQLGTVLFETLNLPHGKKTKSGYSTSKDVLDKIKDFHPIVNQVLEYRTLSKIYSSYIEGLLNFVLKDGKIHNIYTQTLTRTGRLSSIEPNLQNIPMRYEYGRLVRKAFVPTYDWFVSSDYSQIELRVLAHLSNVDSLIEAFKSGRDFHTKTAMEIFGVPEQAVTPNMRRQAKAVNFGIIYGISSFGLSENLDMNIATAKKFIDKYLEKFDGVKQYMDDTIQHAYEKGYVETLTGRRRYIDELQNKNYMIRKQGERMALNTPIQGTSSDIIKKAMIELSALFKEKQLKSKMVIQVHDELVLDVPEEEKEVVTKLVTDVMEQTYQLQVPLKVETEYGRNWYEAK